MTGAQRVLRGRGDQFGVKSWCLDGFGVQVGGEVAGGGPGRRRFKTSGVVLSHVGHRRDLRWWAAEPATPAVSDVIQALACEVGRRAGGRGGSSRGTIPTMYGSGCAFSGSLLLLLFTVGQIREIASMWPMSR